jgi:FAD/FMN-containing dehydrogenase
MREEKELSTIVGKENVLFDPKSIEGYAGDMSFVSHVRPRCVVKPANADEVQAIVKWANDTQTPLVPVSSGAPHFRGDTIPRIGGAVIVDLTRMKKIMRIDPRNKVAWVEPGVTYGELLPELKKAGLAPYMPLCPKASKSVLASIVEREPTTMPAQHWDATDPYLCGEVIYGTGDKMRTGEAAGPETTEAQWKLGKAHMTPFGLAQMDENKILSGAQGSIGILTWASMKCRLASELSRSFFVPSATIEPLNELAYQMLRIRLGDHFFILNDLNLACLLAKTPEEIKSIREKLPAWVLFVSVEGRGKLPREKVECEEADFMDMVGRAGLKAMPAIAGANADDLSRILSGPSGEPYWKLKHKGGGREGFFITTLDKTPDFVAAVSDLARSGRFSSMDMGVYIQPVVQGTSCHCEFDLYYAPQNAAETERVKRVVTEGAARLADMGAFFSRPYGPWAKVAFRHDEGTTLLKKVKHIFDPNNVLNPGQLCF